ncbi:MAG: glycosyltransferase family 4 protein [Gemmatimonadales bacterium]
MKCLHIVLNSFTHDSRVLKECQTLAVSGHVVTVLALHSDGLPLVENQSFGSVHRVRLRTRGWSKHPLVQMFKYVECTGRMAIRGLRSRPDVVQAHDLEALPIGFLIARLTHARLVYDSHELWEDVTSVRHYPPLLVRLLRFLERACARRADAVITVSGGIARRMASELQIHEPVIVRNLPLGRVRSAPGAGPLRRALGLGPSVPIVLYQGAIGPDYGVDTLVAAMPTVTPTAVAVFLGNGESVVALGESVVRLGLERRVLFHEAVPPDMLLDFTADATIGVCPIRDLSLSYRYCLPNKLFEYIQAGLPVVVSDLPEMAGIVEQYRAGLAFPSGDAAKLADALNSMICDPAALQRFREQVQMAGAELRWELEELKLLQVYGQLAGAA